MRLHFFSQVCVCGGGCTLLATFTCLPVCILEGKYERRHFKLYMYNIKSTFTLMVKQYRVDKLIEDHQLSVLEMRASVQSFILVEYIQYTRCTLYTQYTRVIPFKMKTPSDIQNILNFRLNILVYKTRNDCKKSKKILKMHLLNVKLSWINKLSLTNRSY